MFTIDDNGIGISCDSSMRSLVPSSKLSVYAIVDMRVRDRGRAISFAQHVGNTGNRHIFAHPVWLAESEAALTSALAG